MANVLFIEKRLRTDKLGIFHLSAALKEAGHQVDLVQDDLDDADEYLANRPVDFVMYSVMTSEAPWYLQRNRELKKKHDVISVFGGPHFTFYPDDGAQDSDIDYIVRGPGERAVVEIVEKRPTDKVVRGAFANVEELPFPDRSIQYKYPDFGKANIKRFMAGRFCLHSCRFCSFDMYREIFPEAGEQLRARLSPERLIEEILLVREQYPPLKLVYFNDDDFAVDRRWLTAFCEQYRERVGLPFGSEVRASSVSRDLLRMMKDAGCYVLSTGLESANEETLKLLGRTVSVKQVQKVCEWCAELGIRLSVENMIGLPVDDPLEDALQTLEFNQRVEQTQSWAAIYQPFPGTELWQYCIDRGFLKPTPRPRFPVFEGNTLLEIHNAERIDRLQKWWHVAVRHDLSRDLMQILLDIPLPEEASASLDAHRKQMAARLKYMMGE